MITIVLSSCPPSLRGHLTRWLSEISAGVFVGKVNPRIRDKLWALVTQELGNGRAIMTFTTREYEQGYGFRVHNHEWEIVDVEGVNLVRRPSKARRAQEVKPKVGWSRAGRKHRFRR
ncbi:type I-E CRISPR-associated endoribonuclease Cas2e [Corynebacterium sp. ES2715-CONJ3]|uniref:type I-E CRISPR-associated endoribonuclease Cas2e n=1 Tax=Corynebacterium sp. ES2715-CONJ3 TaxID=2974028 RepID=UPI002169B213|nr:type I-E CRISPR-associated endoribonuclease Cas2e [Corynebacterium sp. ES2715-CONJ3]MCS4492460.1 type I-E CRISPR-associated endoribonuclease Cas2e [Corynebacterium sp. ES2715-CONJ3]